MNEAIDLACNVLIKPFEGLARKRLDGLIEAYPDPGSGGAPWTIGYGSTGADITPHTVWTMQQCEDALDHHVRYFFVGLCKLSPTLRNAVPRRIAAVTSWAYNCGLGNYRISTFKKRIDAEDWEGAATECVKWNKAAGKVLPGLTRRRVAEAAMMR